MEKRTLLTLSILVGAILGAVVVELHHLRGGLTFDGAVNYLEARHNVITAATAVLALLVSLVSITLAAYSMAAQRAHYICLFVTIPKAKRPSKGP